ncbi:radical SAM protein [Methanohalobium sp.]|uniref:radical SAM protein n=1 Tax=Methanohalobium sp. TaxID=2837493 RepID=UPI0025D56F8C|nr:radical SAM protein [Methanohalobium sp.]
MKSFKTPLKAFWQLKIRKRPFVLSHAINSQCNMRCKFCEYWKEDKVEMSTDEIFRMLDDAKSFGIGVYNAWTVEPLLRDDLSSILEHAHHLGMMTSLITNGKLLEKKLDELEYLDLLSVSVDGLDSYKDIRGIDFETILPGIKKAKERLPLMINCVISGKNLDDIVDLINLADELGVKISFEPMYEFEGISEEVWDEFGVKDMDKYHRTVDRIIQMKKQGYPIINSLTYLKMVRDLDMGYKCHANDVILNIAENGTIENCRVHRNKLGHINEGIENVWSSSRHNVRETTNQCQGCLFFGYVENSLLYEFKPEVMKNYDWM